MQDPESFARGRFYSDNVFLFCFVFWKSTTNSAHQCQIALKVGCHRPASKTPFIFCDFPGGPDPLPPLDPRMESILASLSYMYLLYSW